MRWHARFPLLAISLVALTFVIPSSAFAQGDASPTDRLIELRRDWLTQIARQEAAAWEIDLISAPRSGGPAVGNFQDPNAILKELGPVLSREYDVVRGRLSSFTTRAAARENEVRKEWAEVYRQRIAFRQYAEKQQATYGFDFDSNSPAGLNLNVLDAALAGWLALALIVALRLRSRERRLTIRRAQRMAAASVVLLGISSLPGCAANDVDPRAWTTREEAGLTTSIKDATEKADAAVAAANKKWQAAIDAWARLVTAPTASESVDATIQREETKIRDQLREIAVEARLADRMARDMEEQRGKLAEERARLDELISSARWRSMSMASLRVVAAVVLLGLAVTPFWNARRARRAAIRQASRTCPRCFRQDTLKVEKTGGSDSSSHRPRGGKGKPREEPEAEEADDAEVRCTKCVLRIRRSYLSVPRLCFPTVGVRSSGKTHMLVTAYDRIRKRTAPTAAVVQPAPSGGDIDKRFDRLIEEILHRRGEAGATDLALPDPILVHLKDRDPAGANSALVNLFDYSGELINPEVDVNQLKSTAVRMDGFMLLLDPTQLYGDGANVSLDEQLGMLDQFLAHMRKERKVPVGDSIPVPVAVCIPKFDLLVSDNPIGGQSVPFIRQLLEELSPSPKEMTLDIIKARSDLVEEMLPLMFTGADIRQIVEGYFGKQVMFFPMSSVGLFEHELGIRDLSRRTIAPFGVAEPLVWLLHMYGYDVFE
jgi:hypothetical protein